MIVQGSRSRGHWLTGLVAFAVVLAVIAILAQIATTSVGARHRAAQAGPASALAGGRGWGRASSVAPLPETPALVAKLAHGTYRGPGIYVPGDVVLAFRAGASEAQRRSIERAVGVLSAKHLGPRIKPVGHGRATGPEYLEPLELRVARAQTLAVIERLQRYAAVAYAEPNYLQQATGVPEDPYFGKQWGSNNTGQSIPTQNNEETVSKESEPGIVNADDQAVPAWSVTTGSRSIVVAELDTGVQYTHPDLKENIWSNPGGIGKCPAGTHGFNTLWSIEKKTEAEYCNPNDFDTVYKGHGTHVAGTIGAVGNNGIGVVGINWKTTILPVRWMETALKAETARLIEAMQIIVAAKQEGVNIRVINDSGDFTGSAKSEALEKEIETLGANNILYVSPAGNNGSDNDEPGTGKGTEKGVGTSDYPCDYDKANQICVTSINHDDELPGWASYGPKTVDMAAPGVSIFSTQAREAEVSGGSGYENGAGYGYMSGASTSVPQVSGAAALILSIKPTMSATELKADIVNNVD